jgi:Asp-tRNA(Asn)/Glu-tRNA(Gln) amidotransferase A subunit family amidase
LVHGSIARNVEDAALTLHVMSGGDARDPVSANRPPLPLVAFTKSPRHYRLAISLDLGLAAIDETVSAVFWQAIERVKSLGVEVEEEHPDCTGAQESFETIRAAMLYDSLGPYVESGFDQLSETVRWNAERGRHLSASALLQAEAVRGELHRRFAEFLSQLSTESRCATSSIT